MSSDFKYEVKLKKVLIYWLFSFPHLCGHSCRWVLEYWWRRWWLLEPQRFASLAAQWFSSTRSAQSPNIQIYIYWQCIYKIIFCLSLLMNECDQFKCKRVDIYFMVCGHGEALESDGHVAQTLLKRCHQVGLWRKTGKMSKEGSSEFNMMFLHACIITAL